MPRTLFINGTVGVGKTSVAEAVSQLLEGRIPHATIDTDALRRRWPVPSDDPFDLELELRNLSALSDSYRKAGAELLVVSGVIESREVVPRYCAATGVEYNDRDFVLVRLTATHEMIVRRIRERHIFDETKEWEEWHIRRAPELDAILDKAGLPGTSVSAELPVNSVARLVLEALGPR